MTHLRVGLKFSSVRCSVFSFRWLNTHKNTLNPPKSSTGHLTPRLSSRHNNRQRVYFTVFGVTDLSLKKHRRNVEFLYRIQCGDAGHLSRLRHPDLDPDYTRVRRLHIQKWSSSFQERCDLDTIRGIFTEFSSTRRHRMLQNIFLALDRQYFTAQVVERWWNGVQYERVCPQTFEFQCCVRGQRRSVRLVFCHDWSLNRKNCSHHEHSLLVKGFSIFEIALRCSRPARGLFIMATFHQPLQRLS